MEHFRQFLTIHKIFFFLQLIQFDLQTMYVGFLKWTGHFSFENFFTILSNEKNSFEKNLNRQFKIREHSIHSTNVQNTVEAA
jgi:hypothetical protein